jgi:hypothetical protein
VELQKKNQKIMQALQLERDEKTVSSESVSSQIHSLASPPYGSATVATTKK